MDNRSPYNELCSFRNLELAYRKARKGKRNKYSVQKFEYNLEQNLLQLKQELETFIYRPRPLKQFVIKDPKTRVISSSHFRDRVVHHALCNIIQPILEKAFIYDSHANQLNKGSSKAIERFDKFKRKVSENGRLSKNPKDNNMVVGYALKADIRHFFDTIDQEILLHIIERKVKDKNVIWLIKRILENHKTNQKGKGMPLGNLTSQFFANLYLNELDYFVKHKLRAKYYIRYVDDFILMESSKTKLKFYKQEIKQFLKGINLELHPEKSKICHLSKGINFLGFRIFCHYRLLSKRNIRKAARKFAILREDSRPPKIRRMDIEKSFVGWIGYAQQANTYKLREL